MNEKNKKRQNEKKRIEQKQMLLKMKKEIETMENEINDYKFEYIKKSTIKNLKITARAFQLVAPYILTAGIVAEIFNISGNKPFSSNNERVYLNTMTEFYSMGNINIKKQYGDFKDSIENILDNRDSVLYFYSKWEKDSNNSYYRIIEIYSIKNKTYEDVKKILSQDDLEKYLDGSNYYEKEIKNDLNIQELNSKNFIKAIVYDKDKNDYIEYKKNIFKNISCSIIYIFLASFCEFIPFYLRSNYSKFDFMKSVNKINEKYKTKDINVLIKKLEIKKNNYDRMMR